MRPRRSGDGRGIAGRAARAVRRARRPGGSGALAERSTVHDLQDDPAASPQPRPPKRPRRRTVWAATGAVAALGAGAVAALLTVGHDDAPARQKADPAPATSPASPAPSRRSAGKTGTTVVQGPVVNGRRQPPRVKIPASAGGRYAVVPGRAKPPAGSRGTLVRYMVEVERGLPITGADFAAEVQRVLNDPRSWGHGGTLRFERVARGPVRFRVALSSPAMTDRMCAPLVTGGELSCRHGERSVINALRYGEGAASYGRDLASYREYVINHEVGHALGHDHRQCPGKGRPAPVMVQQTKSLYGCAPNPWPFPKG
ncbi:DUF3152 domain-containing protein [Actinomadura opuntiae]|uniref:DUF3152 domain-containing protein n=1 Tax=Actinomadura sp. OS1-43 TaxID=604315 RepID=UPI00255AAA71|nr:DUF3152 domain-containing protein [Actinomadura sp. OS1-43]MDL4821751.1 DUF3152 domain-containing protein [Actinomadura sp. OS1-43]